MRADFFGFLPSADGEENRNALQRAVDACADVEIEIPGVYEFEGTLYIPSGRHLRFAPGTVLKRVPEKGGKNGYCMINKGAFTGETNEDISVDGLTLEANGVESAAALAVDILDDLARQGEKALNDYFDNTILGLRGQIAFFYVKGLTLTNFTLNDLCEWDYAVHISDFDGVLLENIHIEGNKDAIHFGPGKNFVLRNGVFRTLDDPIALNADDYAPSAPNIGTIENGLIENCVDLEQEKTCGYFVRLLPGAAADWTQGMTIRHSDSVIHNGRFYRAVLPDDGTEKISLTPPTHDRGFAILDGIPWIRTHLGCTADELPYAAEIKNVTFKDLRSEKTRPAVVILYIADNKYHRGWRRGSPVPYVRDICFDGVTLCGKAKDAFLLSSPFENFVIKNSSLNGAAVRFEPGACGVGTYPASFTLENLRDFRMDDAGAFSENGKHDDYAVKY